VIRAENLRKVYRRRGGELSAIDGVSLDVRAGECVVLLGPSGSGKSTLLNMLGGLLRPSAGRVLLDGVDLCALSPAARVRLRREKVGFVFQSFHLVPYLTAAENVAVALDLRAGGKVSVREAAVALLARVGLGDRADHLPDELSVGECQRVALARAVAGSPKAILADEPTGNLDPAAAAVVAEHLRRFSQEGAAVVVVTHDPQLAGIADRRMRLEGGRIPEGESLDVSRRGNGMRG
jgi:putative ABC transport system ATP-binding protein